ncbi:MAG TPA: hypothetical protein VMJ10_17875 [Kofleriaceae bacterium]|nr:hypothetical protein [Kofleriaceae bacterium]
MRRVAIVLVIAAASVAHANSSRYTPLVNANEVDPGCRELAVVPLNTETSSPSFDAAISTASCMVSARTRHLVLAPDAASVRALDDAVAPAWAILERVVAAGDPEHVLLARYAELDIVTGNAARLLASVPHISPLMTAQDVHDHYKLVLVADALAQPWRQRAIAIRHAIARLLLAHPELATHDEVLAYEVEATRLVELAPR